MCVVAAAAHLPVIDEHLATAPYIGVSFIGLAFSCVVLAILLLRSDTRQLYLMAAVVCGVAVLAYLWSRLVGLPEITDDIGHWTDPLGLVAVTSESMVVVLSVGALLGLTQRRTVVTLSARTRILTVVVLLLGLGWTGVAAASTNQSPMSAMSQPENPSNYWSQVAGAPFRSNGVTRVYYVSADVVDWNYAPTSANQITGAPFDDVANTYVKSGPGRIGSSYLKCLYRQYSDAKFSTVTQRSAADQYLGFLGPVIRAEVGDTIRVVFRNTCPFGASMHPHGVLYAKNGEGAPYNDGTVNADKLDDAVPTGSRHTYVWEVPERAGPGPHDGSSVMWMYHSHTDEVGDTYAGLMGPMVITGRGRARADGTPKDVDAERFILFSVMNENKSPFLEQNDHQFETPFEDTTEDEGFEESNLMHSINGYVFGNGPMITMKRGEHVRWYVMSMGTEVDLHTPHWHGNDVVVGGMRMDVVNLLPATMVVADMVPDNAGIWLFHCHVNDHITAGMITRYAVS